MDENSDLRGKRITVYGSGAIGGTVGAYLQEAGYDIQLVDADPARLAAVTDEGLRFTGCRGEKTFRPSMIPVEVLRGPLEAVFLCVKGHHTASATDRLSPLLAPNGWILSLQNGLNETAAADLVGRGRTIGAFVHLGADLIEPGVIQLGYEATIHVGELDGRRAPIDDPLGRTLCRFICAETYRVARTQVGRIEAIVEFEPEAFAPGEGWESRADATLDALADVWRRSMKQQMGIWRDLKIRKRKTEVDEQVAKVITIGDAEGILTPFNRAVLDLVHEIEGGQRGMDRENLKDVLRRADDTLEV